MNLAGLAGNSTPLHGIGVPAAEPPKILLINACMSDSSQSHWAIHELAHHWLAALEETPNQEADRDRLRSHLAATIEATNLCNQRRFWHVVDNIDVVYAGHGSGMSLSAASRVVAIVQTYPDQDHSVPWVLDGQQRAVSVRGIRNVWSDVIDEVMDNAPLGSRAEFLEFLRRALHRAISKRVSYRNPRPRTPSLDALTPSTRTWVLGFALRTGNPPPVDLPALRALRCQAAEAIDQYGSGGKVGSGRRYKPAEGCRSHSAGNLQVAVRARCPRPGVETRSLARPHPARCRYGGRCRFARRHGVVARCCAMRAAGARQVVCRIHMDGGCRCIGASARTTVSWATGLQ